LHQVGLEKMTHNITSTTGNTEIEISIRLPKKKKTAIIQQHEDLIKKEGVS
jgi:hypothetical protein